MITLSEEHSSNHADRERLNWLLDEDNQISIEYCYKRDGKLVLEYLESREDIDRMIFFHR